MSTEKVIQKYIQLIGTEHFSKYEKDFAHRMERGLCEGYQRGDREPKIVSVVEAIVNNVNGLSASANKFRISTKGIFIHGNKSLVEFEYYGSKTQRELGDLIFIISVVYNNKKYFEKLTITQFKKSVRQPKWYFGKKDVNGRYPDKEQLYLLARFPPFRGKRGIILRKEYNLPNYSNCLGSYGLVYQPGDFAFASAKIVELILRSNKYMSLKYILHPLLFFGDAEELSYTWYKLRRYYFRNRNPFFTYPIFYSNFPPVIGNSICSYNVYEFTEKYLRALIGELIFAYKCSYNKPAFQFLQELMRTIEVKAQREKNETVLGFINFFYQHAYGEERGGKIYGDFDYEGGEIGMIHTVINLEEGEQ